MYSITHPLLRRNLFFKTIILVLKCDKYYFDEIPFKGKTTETITNQILMIKIYRKLKDKIQCTDSASKVFFKGNYRVYSVTEVLYWFRNPIFMLLGQGLFT